MMAVITVAAVFAEALVKRGVLSAADAQSLLSDIAEEIRNDGDEEAGQLARPSYVIASAIEQRAIALGKKPAGSA
jgi:hypothetical protein